MLATGYVLLDTVVNLSQIVFFAVGLCWMTMHLLATWNDKGMHMGSISAMDDDAPLSGVFCEFAKPGKVSSCWKQMCVCGPSGQCPPKVSSSRCQPVCHTSFNPLIYPGWMQSLWHFSPDFCLKLTVGFALLNESKRFSLLVFGNRLRDFITTATLTKLKLSYSVVKWWSAECIKTCPDCNFTL